MKLEPGRELDALIAEKVMGIPVRDGKITSNENWTYGCPTCHYDGLISVDSVPAYSTDIAAAWEVVEKLKAKIFGLEIELSSSHAVQDEWEVSVGWLDDEQGYGPFYFCASTAPHAISLAALKAVGAL